jgi:hypothetical protein
MPTVFDENASVKALDHLLDVVASENGLGFMDAQGRTRFIARHALLTQFATVRAVFSDGPSLSSYPDAVPYVDLTPETTKVVNDWSAKRDEQDAPTFAVEDTSSVDEFGRRSGELTMLVASDEEVQSALQYRLGLTSQPFERIDSIVVKPGDDLSRWETVVSLEVGDRVKVIEQPPGFATPQPRDYFVRHIAAEIPTDLKASEFTFQLVAADTVAWFVVDDAVNGRLDENALAY